MDWFYDHIDDNQLKIFEALNSLFLSFPEIEYKIRYRIPFYSYYSWFCYINPIKKGGIELCFLRGKQLSQYGSALQSKDRITVAGLHIESSKSIPIDLVMECFTEAMYLDQKIKAAK